MALFIRQIRENDAVQAQCMISMKCHHLKFSNHLIFFFNGLPIGRDFSFRLKYSFPSCYLWILKSESPKQYKPAKFQLYCSQI